MPQNDWMYSRTVFPRLIVKSVIQYLYGGFERVLFSTLSVHSKINNGLPSLQLCKFWRSLKVQNWGSVPSLPTSSEVVLLKSFFDDKWLVNLEVGFGKEPRSERLWGVVCCKGTRTIGYQN